MNLIHCFNRGKREEDKGTKGPNKMTKKEVNDGDINEMIPC
jgi:hypothetical protein